MISISTVTSSVSSAFLKLIIFVIVLGISFLPSIIAFARTNSNRKQVFMLNIVAPIVLGFVISFLKMILSIEPFQVLFNFINEIANIAFWVVSLVRAIRDI